MSGFSPDFRERMLQAAAFGGITPEKAVSALQTYLSNPANGTPSLSNGQKHYYYNFPREIAGAATRNECMVAMEKALRDCNFKAVASYDAYHDRLSPGQFMFFKREIVDHDCNMGCQLGSCPETISTCEATHPKCGTLIICLPW